MAEYKTLEDIYKSDTGLQKEFPDMLGKGISGEWTLKDWYNQYGKVDYPNIEMVQPGDKRIVTGNDSTYKTSDALSNEQRIARFSTDPTTNDTNTDQNTVWLYDSKEKTYRPVGSPEALKSLLKTDTVEEAFSFVNVLPSSVRDTKEWEGSLISNVDRIKEDGAIPKTSTFIEGSEILNLSHYGRLQMNELENKAMKLVNGLTSLVKDTGVISSAVFDKYLNNKESLAKYVDAIAYGGYDVVNNVYKDLRAKTLAEEGNTQYENFKAFDSNIKNSEWLKTDEGKSFTELTNSTDFTPPPELDFIDWEGFSNSIFDIPDSAFKTLVKPIDINSKEFKQEAEKIQAAYYDVMEQTSKATTAQDKAVADYNWKTLTDNIEKKYDIKLSRNATEAWGQLQNLFKGHREAGLSNTGIEKEASDRYLRDVRKNDELIREGKLDETEEEKRTWLLNAASSEEISKFASENPDKAKDWGLMPSDEQKQWFSKENLKKLYPDMSDTEIDTMSNIVINPETGLYNSKIYQSLNNNVYNIRDSKKTYQWEKLFNQKKLEAEKAYREYTHTNSFLRNDDAKLPDDLNPNKDTVDTEGTVDTGKIEVPDNTKKKDIYGIDRIRKAFGSTWNPSEAFKGSNDYLGAVRVAGDNTVYGIGDKAPKSFTADSYKTRFGSDNQKGIVGEEISKKQANILGIAGY